MPEAFEMFVGERSPNVVVERAREGIAVQIEDGFVILSIKEATSLMHAVMQVAVNIDRDATFKAVVGL